MSSPGGIIVFSSFERPVFRLRVRSPAHLRHRRRRFCARPMAQDQRRDADARRVLCALPCFAFRLLISSVATGRQFGMMVLLAVLVMLTMAATGALLSLALRLSRAESTVFLLVVMFSNGGNYGLPVVRSRSARTRFLWHGVLSDGFGVDEHRRRVPGGRRAPQPAHGSHNRTENAGHLRHGRRACRARDRHRGADVPPQASHDAERRRASADDSGPRDAAGTRVCTKAAALVAAAVCVSLIVAPLVALGLTSMFGVTGAARQAVVVLSSMPVAGTTILAVEFDASPTS